MIKSAETLDDELMQLKFIFAEFILALKIYAKMYAASSHRRVHYYLLRVYKKKFAVPLLLLGLITVYDFVAPDFVEKHFMMLFTIFLESGIIIKVFASAKQQTFGLFAI